MIPYREIKHRDTGETVQEPWPSHLANAKLWEFREQVKAELAAEDEKKIRSIGTDDPIVINRLRHDGATTTDMTNDRWYEFCSKPQPFPTSKIRKKHPSARKSSALKEALTAGPRPGETLIKDDIDRPSRKHMARV